MMPLSRPFLLSMAGLLWVSSTTEAFTQMQQSFNQNSALCMSSEPAESQLTTTSSRRNLLQQGLLMATATVISTPLAALAAAADEGNVPMLSLDEFLIILRDSARSIQRVEFSGPQAETVRVRLIDGTVFGIKDIIESPTDPRSPLKVQAACREFNVPFKNLQMESILATAPKKTKMYTNQRVQEAAQKTKDKLERQAKDEEERLAKLYELEGAQANRATN